jgi:hypothetical protein
VLSIFKAANYEESEGDRKMNEINDDLALMRFEFVEAITRAAIVKYEPQSRLEPFQVHTGLNTLLENCVFPNTINLCDIVR